MTANHEERWKEICAKATVEKNPAQRLELIAQINRLLNEKFHHPRTTPPKQNKPEHQNGTLQKKPYLQTDTAE